MIDEKRIIAKLEKRIDDFVKAHPDQKDDVSVQVIQEFIHMLELGALQRIANSLEKIEKKIGSPIMNPEDSNVEKGDTDAESHM